MKHLPVLFVWLCAGGAFGQDWTEKDFLSRARRLTFEGRRAGEGYFSPDGTQMVFQSEREPGNPFYQIYLLDLTTGDSKRISSGQGKPTCAFFQPGSGNILFASTHHDARSVELQKEELRASGQERRYAWDYDAEMEIYMHERASGELKRLTHVWGYDAEASYSPDGESIVFASLRDPYARQLSSDEEKLLGVNPSFFADIYVMRSDGTQQTRLTDVPGYDGGPFFFPDGSRIVWRRFDEEGVIADIWTMKPDGSDPKQITSFGSMSWAPYVHPSMDYVFFASNKLGLANFEFYIVDVEGEREPLRVTYTDGFDGLPVPSPDGTKLAWTSNRDGGNGGQIEIAEWNHERALIALEASTRRAHN